MLNMIRNPPATQHTTYNAGYNNPNSIQIRRDVPTTYASNRPLDLQEKVITMIKKSVNTSTKNLRENVSTSKLF